MFDLVAGFCLGSGVTILTFVLFPKASAIAANVHRSRALSKANALIAAAEANAAALAAAHATVAAAKVAPPPAPPNPLAPTGATGP